MGSSRSLASLVERGIERRPPRAKSLVATIFGDAVVPHGGRVWIGTLIRWLEPFGVNERSSRTAIQRLVREGWLENRSAGRRSDYAPTETSRRHFEDAERRIYAAEPPRWSGRWSLVLLGPDRLSTDERDAVRRELRWHGFGELSPTVLVHPGANLAELALDLRDLGVERGAVVLSGRGAADFRGNTPEALRALARTAWDLRDLADEYRSFVERFRPLAHRLAAVAVIDPAVAFRIRVLAVHDYRRILLRDPQLPAELLPEDWIGGTARHLFAEVYRRVERPAREYLRATGETTSGPLPAASSGYFRRFGGLHHPGRSRRPRPAPRTIARAGRP